jgi:hypothetical protein
MVKIFVHFLILYIRKLSLYITCTRSHLNFLVYEENFVFFFISVRYIKLRAFYEVFGHLRKGGCMEHRGLKKKI